MPAQRRETIEDMFPKAVMAAASTDRTRSSAAMECSAHRRPAGYGTGESEEEEDRKEDGDCQVDPGPTCQRVGRPPRCVSTPFSENQPLVSPVFRRKSIAKIILGMALPHSVCEPIIGNTDICLLKRNLSVFQNLCIHENVYTAFLKLKP